MIEIKDIKVTYKDNTSLEFKDLIFKDKEVTIVSGRNGSGKSTLLKAIANILPVTGDMKVKGEVTYNSQEPVLFNRSVMRNITFPLETRSLDINTFLPKIKEYSSVLSITDLLDKNANSLSSGEKMKVSIVRSIIFNPTFVLLDEPTTHLDLESIHELKKLIHALKNNITFIVVSHNKDFIDDIKDNEIRLGG